mmetsp:Transcript_6167/g.11684  ORF Transcript_6167/g.11684 Transcript_6167/m.11684 type:complete len:309 (+) Transcript_6167:1051-1977(+)
MNLLDDSENDGTAHIISWFSNGKGFAIRNKKLFVETVLPNHFFKDVQFTSFTRKLRRWGFRSYRIGHNQIAYSHEMFMRGDKISCLMMCPLNNERDVPASSVRSRAADLLQQPQRHRLSSATSTMSQDKETLLVNNPVTVAQNRNQQVLIQQDSSMMVLGPMAFPGHNPAPSQVMTYTTRRDIPSISSLSHQVPMAHFSSLITPTTRVDGSSLMTHRSDNLFTTHNSSICSLDPYRFFTPPFISQSSIAKSQEQDNKLYSEEPFLCKNLIDSNPYTNTPADTSVPTVSLMTSDFSGPVMFMVKPSYSI